MGKPDQESAAAEEARRATGDAAGRGRGGRLSARRKRETVLRLLRGEGVRSRAGDHGGAGRADGRGPGQPSRAPDAWDEANRRLQPGATDCSWTSWRWAALWPDGGRGDETPTRSPRGGRMACSGSAACGTAPALACMRGGRRQRPGRRVGVVGRWAPPRTTCWPATSADCSKPRPFTAKGTGKPGRSSGSRGTSLERVRRLITLQAPHRVGHAHGPKAHDARSPPRPQM